MKRDFVLIFIVLGAVVPLLGRRRINQLMRSPATSKKDRFRLYASTAVFQWIAATFILWRAHLHGIGNGQLGIAISKPILTFVVAIVLTTLLLANQIIALRKLGEHPEEIRGVMPQLASKIFPQDNAERVAFTGVVITVALCEEFIFRGFVQSVFRGWSHDSVAVAILGSSALFAWAHLYQGRRGLISTFIVGLLFSSVRAWTLSLFPATLAHFAADLVVGFLAPSRFKAAFASLAKGPDPSVHRPLTTI
jgi:membrane protease YdiL (CAAX protease family)